MLGHDEDFDSHAPDHLEGQSTDVAHGDAFRDGRAADRDLIAGQALRHRGIGFYFHAKDLDVGLQPSGGDSAPGELTAAADRNDERVEIRRILQQFERERALARDHCRIVVGMDEDEVLGFRQGIGVFRGFSQRVRHAARHARPRRRYA